MKFDFRQDGVVSSETLLQLIEFADIAYQDTFPGSTRYMYIDSNDYFQDLARQNNVNAYAHIRSTANTLLTEQNLFSPAVQADCAEKLLKAGENLDATYLNTSSYRQAHLSDLGFSLRCSGRMIQRQPLQRNNSHRVVN